MNRIAILGKTFGFLGWKKSPRSFYCGADDDLPRVVELIPALPDGVSELPGPDHVNPDLKAIQPCLLLSPPPDLGPDEILDGWQKIYVETQTIRRPFLTGDDDELLQKALDNYKTNQRRIYEWELKVAEKIENPKERAERLELLQLIYEAPLHYIAGQRAAGNLNQDLEMVKAGAAGIRDDYLARQWAQQEGVDLDVMDRHRLEFFGWLRKNVGCEKRRLGRIRFLPMLSGLADPRFLECCARVRFRCEFTDGSVVYLANYKQATPALEESQALKKLLTGGLPTNLKKVVPEKLRKVRSAASKEKAQIKDPHDIKEIMRAVHARMHGGVSLHAAASEVTELLEDGRETLGLSQDYPGVKPDTVKRVAGLKK